MKNKLEEIIIDEDSVSVFGDPLKKLEEIKDLMKEPLQCYRSKIEYNESREKPLKVSYNTAISNKLNINMRKWKQVEYNYGIGINANELNSFINCFYELVDFIVDYIYDFVPTKLQFCAFVGITSGVYNKLLSSNNPEVLMEISSFEDFLADTTFTSSQSGGYKETSTMNRLKAKGVGHDIEMKNESEKQPQMTFNVYSDPNFTRKKLDSLLGNKFLNNGEKK